MGRPLILACDNCIPGDASPYYLPLALVTIVVGALAWWALRRARGTAGRRRVLLRAGAIVLMAGPLGAILVVSSDVTYDRAICGSALKTSLDRPRPGMALDATQEGCRRKGERIVAAATAYGVAATAVALVVLAGAALPVRPVPAPAG